MWKILADYWTIKLNRQNGRLHASLAKVQLCEENENQTLEAFVAASCLYAKFDCPVARQNVSLSYCAWQ